MPIGYPFDGQYDGIKNRLGMGAFSPNQLAGLSLWLDADDASTITEAGGSVSQWDDKSGNGNDATQTTEASKPTTGISTINGLNALDFDGDDDWLIGASGTISISLSDHTIFFVAHLDTLDELQCFINWNDNTGSTNRELFCFVLASGNLNVNGTIGSSTIIGDDLQNTDMLVSINVNPGMTMVTRLDGVQKTSNAISLVSSADAFSIAAEFDAGSVPGNFTNIKVGEIIMYDRNLSASETQAIEGYLSSKWGIALP
ncbi:MAG: hypothetical protein V3U60_16330 [Gammaproteobacteria bacterium]